MKVKVAEVNLVERVSGFCHPRVGVFDIKGIEGKTYELISLGHIKQDVPFGPSYDPLPLETDIAWILVGDKFRSVALELVSNIPTGKEG